MVRSFLISPHCNSPQENSMLESGIPEWFTSLGLQENLELCRNTGCVGQAMDLSAPLLPWHGLWLRWLLLCQGSPCPAPRAQPRIQNCPGSCAQAARAQKPYTGHPWRRDALARFKQTSPAPRSTVVIRSKKIPSGPVQWG